MSKAKKSKAGKKSGKVRAAALLWRRADVAYAFTRLKPAYKVNPFSEESLRALEEECCGKTAPECCQSSIEDFPREISGEELAGNIPDEEFAKKIDEAVAATRKKDYELAREEDEVIAAALDEADNGYITLTGDADQIRFTLAFLRAVMASPEGIGQVRDRSASRDTLKKDLAALRIRSKRFRRARHLSTAAPSV